MITMNLGLACADRPREGKPLQTARAWLAQCLARGWALVFALLLGWGLGVVHAAELDRTDHVSDVEVFFDTQGQLGVNDLDQVVFQSHGQTHRQGYFEGVTWLRLRITPATDGGALFLRVRPHNRNALTLYTPDPSASLGWRAEETGNQVAWQDRPVFGQDLGFMIRPQQETTYYLRLQTAGSGSLEVTALTQGESARQDVINNLWRMAYLFVIMVTVAWALHTYSLNRDRVVLAFAVTHLMYVVLALTSLGYLDALMPDRTFGADLLFWMVLLTTTAALVFHLLMLLPFGMSTPLRWVYGALGSMNLIAIGLKLAGELTPALQLNSVAILLVAPLLFITVLRSQKGGVPDKRTRLVYYALLLASVLMHLLPVLGLFDLPRWGDAFNVPNLSSALLYGHLYYGFISALLFGHFLHVRARGLFEASQSAILALGVAEREVAWQKNRLQEQAQFMSMLTHELKNPLASIRLTVDTLEAGGHQALAARHQRIGRAVQDIDALVDRCVLVDSIEQGRVQLMVVDLDPEQLVQDVLAKFPTAQPVELMLADDLPMMDTDERLLETALSNLLENALKYTSDPSSVHVKVSSSDDAQSVYFEVSNLLGPGGVPDLDQLFDKYHRGKHTNGHRGTGLGLFVVRWIAERLGGEVQVKLMPAQRIAFRLCLPLTPHRL